jgi:hypothetical protein
MGNIKNDIYIIVGFAGSTAGKIANELNMELVNDVLYSGVLLAMAWIITNKSTHLEFADGNTKYLLPKSDVKLKLVDDKVKVYSDANERDEISLNYQNVSSPSEASNAALYASLVDYMETAASGSSSQTEVAYNNASTQLVAENLKRKGVLVVNKTDVALTVELGDVTVVLNEGLQVETDKATFIETTEEVKFICNTATSGKVIAVEYL